MTNHTHPYFLYARWQCPGGERQTILRRCYLQWLLRVLLWAQNEAQHVFCCTTIIIITYIIITLRVPYADSDMVGSLWGLSRPTFHPVHEWIYCTRDVMTVNASLFIQWSRPGLSPEGEILDSSTGASETTPAKTAPSVESWAGRMDPRGPERFL